MKYPGDCLLEFQSVMQILCMLRWDTKTQSSRGKGILGMVLAFFCADEEQGRKTLHQHWQIWVQELNQTLQDCLFDTDATKRKNARKTFCQHIDNVISACYGPDLSITHRCIDGDENEQLKVDTPVQGTKNCMMKSREALCTVLTVNKPYLPLTLLTRHYKDGKTV
jgi:hypothetical protein